MLDGPYFCSIWVKMNALNKFWKILEIFRGRNFPVVMILVCINYSTVNIFVTDKDFADKVREPERNDMFFFKYYMKFFHKYKISLLKMNAWYVFKSEVMNTFNSPWLTEKWPEKRNYKVLNIVWDAVFHIKNLLIVSSLQINVFGNQLKENLKVNNKNTRVSLNLIPSYQQSRRKVLKLTLSWRRLLPYINQSIDLQSKSMDWFLYDNGLRHERIKFLRFW